MIKDKNILNIANKQKVLLPVILISNLMPLYGVINLGWTIFSVVYLYWFELLIITFFQFLKIILAKGEPEISLVVKIFIGLKFLFVRFGVFLFYLLFIVVFLGFMTNINSKDNAGLITMAQAIGLKTSFYRITVLSFILYNLLDFLLRYIVTKKYLTAKVSDYNVLLDVRIIVVHIVVILGTFLYEGLTEKLNVNQYYVMIACVSLFIVVKIIADVIRGWSNDEDTSEEIGKYI